MVIKRSKSKSVPKPEPARLNKVPTGINGFDEITAGGLPENRIALVSGGPGSGKTLFSMEFLVHGAIDHDEPGVFVAFEETPDELSKNVASLGLDLNDLIKRKKLLVDYIPIERSEIEETGDYDLEGLFIRLNFLIDSMGAKRIVLDTLEALFSGFSNQLILRAELRRLFRWLKNKGVTAIVTAERGAEGTLTRHGLEEYVSDCVIVLDHLVRENVATRRLRVVKYRGSRHGTNEYPFLIGNQGISVLPITSVGLNFRVSSTRVASGIPVLDHMLAGGFYRGSSVLISGTAGTGKSTFAATVADATCRKGGKCLYLAFEESQDQIIRNMKSVGIDLEPWVKKEQLYFHTVRPSLHGLEMHLVTIHDLVVRLKPDMVIFDPISNLMTVGTHGEVKSMLMRLIDYLKVEQITTVFTNLLSNPDQIEATEVGVSSLMDTWIVIRDTESEGERNRVLHIIKSRGTAHSNQLREFLITGHGIELLDTYTGKGRVLTGSARAVQEAQDKAEGVLRNQEVERKLRESERKRKVIEAQIGALQAQLENEQEEAQRVVEQDRVRSELETLDRKRLTVMRKADSSEATQAGENHKKLARK